MEAGTGIEPVYTDLQSPSFPQSANGLGEKKYQDKAGTPRERDTRHYSAARIFRIALTLGAHRFTEDGRMAAWLDFAKVLAVRLTERERALVAYWVLRTLGPETRLAVFEGAHLGAADA